jgi:uncharacterized protein YdiU (UPF0061 family)
MNTDNMSIIGLTIDYGPFGFLDEFDAGFICNHSDYGGRYAFDQQPQVALWNLYKLAQTLVPLIKVEAAEEVLGEYQTIFTERFLELMRGKLGLQAEGAEDAELISGLFDILQKNTVDYTRFFRRLGEFKTNANNKNASLQGMFIDPQSFDVWATTYRARLLDETSIDSERRALMMLVNPKFVLRNHIAQAAIEKAQAGDFTETKTLLEVLQKPFDEQPDMKRFAAPPPERSQRVAVSCSS